jgi:ADP-ribose pyrophosphatase
MTGRTYTHPDVLTLGVAEGWADPETDPTRIDWTARQERAAIPFEVIDGRPVNPCESTGIRHGRNEFGHWGEALMADALVTISLPHCPVPFLLMVQREDGHGWAVPGGHVEPGETGVEAAVRELVEETSLGVLLFEHWEMAARYVPDPRASDEAWAVTIPVHFDLGWHSALPAVTGGDDALRAAWLPAGGYQVLAAAVDFISPGAGVFAAHVPMLTEFLGSMSPR